MSAARGDDAMSAATHDTLAPLRREWIRHTPAERLTRWVMALLVVAATVWAIRSIDVIPEFLADAAVKAYCKPAAPGGPAT